MQGKRNEGKLSNKTKRSVILKRQLRNMFAGIAIVLCVSMSFSAFFVSAKEKETTDNESSHIYYRSIRIEQGDTLWDIASENLPVTYSSVEKYVEVLKEINGLSSDEIFSGENLMIAYTTKWELFVWFGINIHPMYWYIHS